MPKGRKPNTVANTVFTGVVKRDGNNALLEVQFNDAVGKRQTQKLILTVVNGVVVAAPADVPAVAVEGEIEPTVSGANYAI